ncbi:formyltransferase family protein [Halopelagius fulvigenes]|uniref:Formyltransferase family protein n=1 Tax=Halopelagius fulvigenes TaxID=1198324 RepID=A0ABD5TTT3_9EURY
MTANSERPLRVVVLCDECVPRWEKRALERTVSRTDAEISHVVFRDSEARPDGVGAFLWAAARQVREYPLWSMVGAVRMATETPKYERLAPIKDVDGVPEAEWTYCAPKPADGLGEVLPDSVVESAVSDADVAVRLTGFGILMGDVLRAPTHGVLSYHVGDIREYRGVMGAGFWEFLEGRDEMGVTVQRLTETIDGGRIVALERFDISELHTWQEVKARAFRVAEGTLSAAVENVADPAFTPAEPDRLGEVRYPPTGTDVLDYLRKNTAGRLRRVVPSRAVESDHPVRD